MLLKIKTGTVVGARFISFISGLVALDKSDHTSG